MEMNEATSAPPPPPAGASQEDKTLAMLTHLSGIILGFIVPLIIWLVNKDKSDKGWLNDQAKEALNFQITVAIAWLVCLLLGFVVVGFLLMTVLVIGALILTIIAGIKANKGIAYRYPWTWRLVK